MNCYVHAEKDAVGTCVNCGKFICSECATEVNEKFYCKKCIGEILNQKDKEIDQAKTQPQNNTPMVFMNAGGASASSSSSSASSSSGGHRHAPPYPRNSFMLHLILFCFTAGIGNIVYFLYIKNKQRNWEDRYS